MAKNKITDLRDHLFETLEQLKDPEKPMDIERAKAVADVARVIIETAKVEVKAAEVFGVERSAFLGADADAPRQKPLIEARKVG